MEIKRINSYDDNRFSQTVLHQHGCFLVDEKPYEVEIISDYEAIICGEDQTVYSEIIEEFRFYTPMRLCGTRSAFCRRWRDSRRRISAT